MASILRPHNLLMQTIQVAYLALHFWARFLAMRGLAYHIITFFGQVTPRSSVLMFRLIEIIGWIPIKLRTCSHLLQGQARCLVAADWIKIRILQFWPIGTCSIIPNTGRIALIHRFWGYNYIFRRLWRLFLGILNWRATEQYTVLLTWSTSFFEIFTQNCLEGCLLDRVVLAISRRILSLVYRRMCLLYLLRLSTFKWLRAVGILKLFSVALTLASPFHTLILLCKALPYLVGLLFLTLFFSLFILLQINYG